MSSTRKKLLCKPVVVNVGCGCRRPKLSDVFHCKPKTAKAIYGRRNQVYQAYSSSSLEKRDGDSTGTVSPDLSLRYYPHQPEKTSKAPAKRSGRIRESVAVVKESDDPYLDFRQSMLQMILEKEIYSREDLRELLNCFLSLNSPQHHQIIIRAFTEIWNGVYSAPRAEFDVRGRSRPRGSRTYGNLG
ncbi:transcription repressor OFP6-like [Aristolochia californica]|uniref:transcription repressor OFP6-like n=1 Tax=Aristolochia californica TaxID=171875 RepID=UPI0035DD3955